MIAGWTLAGLALLLPLALLDTVLLIETVAGLAASRRRRSTAVKDMAVALLVPAHDEAASLCAHLAALRAVVPAGARILLVADNCTDDTAAIARAAGVEVVERHDPARRGKGYALAFGRDRLALDPPDVAIVLDADCLPDPGAIQALAAAACGTGRPVQGAYLFRPAPSAAPGVQISNFAFSVKNLVRQRGARRIGAAAILTGSGMAFPWGLFATLDLASGEVVEDLALGIALVRRDTPPLFADDATIWSDPSSESGTDIQRARWEGGFLAIARRHALPLVAEGMGRLSWTRLWLGLHLLTPPLALLLTLNLATTLLLAALVPAGLPIALAAGGVALLAAVALAVLAAWFVVGRDHFPAARLIRLPFYLAHKLALHARIASGRQRVAWTRTERVDPDR